MSALSDLLTQAKGDRTVRDVGRSVAKKYDVGESTVIPYFSGKHGNPKDRVLVALAHELDLDVRDLRTAAGLPRGEREPYSPPESANLLSTRQRRAIDELINSFIETGERDGVEDATKQDASSEADQNQKNASRVSTGYGEHADDYDLVGRDTGGISEGEAIRRRMDEQAEQGGA